MRVRWTPAALRDLESLRAYSLKDDAVAANVLVDKIVSAIAGLERHSALARFVLRPLAVPAVPGCYS